MAESNDIREAKETYEGFLGLLKWGTIISIATTAFVLWLIAG